MNWYKKAGNSIVSAYHGTNKLFSSFDRQYAAQGVFWFSTDIDKIKGETSGANSNKYIYSVDLAVENTAGWKEYEDLFLQQIEDKGFDSVKLGDDWIIFDSNRITVKEIYEKQKDGSYELV